MYSNIYINKSHCLTITIYRCSKTLFIYYTLSLLYNYTILINNNKFISILIKYIKYNNINSINIIIDSCLCSRKALHIIKNNIIRLLSYIPFIFINTTYNTNYTENKFLVTHFIIDNILQEEVNNFIYYKSIICSYNRMVFLYNGDVSFKYEINNNIYSIKNKLNKILYNFILYLIR